MGINDYYTQLSTDQAITVNAASEENLDWGRVNPDLGAGTKVRLKVTVKETFTAAGAATLTISIRDSADDAAYADIIVGPAIAKADLVKGAVFEYPLPNKHRRYLQAYFTVATGPMTAGKVDADLIAG